MAKLSFNRLCTVKKIDPITVMHEGQEIIVKQYLPIQEKAELVERVLSASVDETGFFSDIRLRVNLYIELILAYTNITFTEAQLKDPAKLYDLLVMNCMTQFVEDNIPHTEFADINHLVAREAEHIEKYSNSFLGTLKRVQTDYSAAEMDANKLVSELENNENFELVKNILEKIG